MIIPIAKQRIASQWGMFDTGDKISRKVPAKTLDAWFEAGLIEAERVDDSLDNDNDDVIPDDGQENYIQLPPYSNETDELPPETTDELDSNLPPPADEPLPEPPAGRRPIPTPPATPTRTTKGPAKGSDKNS